MSSVTIIVSKKCNLILPILPFVLAGDIDISKESSMFEVIDYLKIINDRIGAIENVKITGGEPLHPDVIEKTRHIVKYLLNPELNQNINYLQDIQINTNGTHNWNDLGCEVLPTFQVSLDGYEDYHDSIRGIGTYNKAVSFIENLISRGYRVNIMSVFTEYNEKVMSHLISFAQEKNIQIFGQIANLSGRGNGIIGEFDDMVKLYNKVLKFGFPCRVVEKDCPIFYTNNSICTNRITIDESGYIIPCPSLNLIKVCISMNLNQKNIMIL